MDSPKNRRLVRLVQGLFVLIGVVWAVLGAVSLLNPPAGASANQPLLMALLMFGNAAALMFCAWAVGRQQGKLDYLILTVLILNLSLTVTDQFGWLDALVLVLYVILLGMVVVLRSRRKGQKNADQPGSDRTGANGAAPEKIDRG